MQEVYRFVDIDKHRLDQKHERTVMLRYFVITCVCAILVALVVLAVARNEDFYSAITEKSFDSIPLQKEFSCTKIGVSSIASDTGSFAKAADIFAYSCGGSLIPPAPQR